MAEASLEQGWGRPIVNHGGNAPGLNGATGQDDSGIGVGAINHDGGLHRGQLPIINAGGNIPGGNAVDHLGAHDNNGIGIGTMNHAALPPPTDFGDQSHIIDALSHLTLA